MHISLLNSRQMGKSSLMVQTMQRLQAEGIVCAAISLLNIGTTDMKTEQWHLSIIDSIVSSLDLYETFDLYTWWEEHRLLSDVRRFAKFIDGMLLATISQPIVIFIDEIDSVLSFEFRHDFFALIRECYNRRAEKPEYRRLTFALLGVTTPSDLMQDKQRTPFNIGRPIELTGFQLDEAEPLTQGLAVVADNPKAVMQAVLGWTGGQPFLTQKICKLLLTAEDTVPQGEEAGWVESLVSARVIENWEAQDVPEHLKTIRDRLLRSGEQRTGRLLGLYQQIVQQGEITANDSPEQMELRLTGLVVKRDGKLRVYNCIYEQVFNRDWLERSLAALRPYGSAIAAWLESDCQDESRLLRGQALQDARTWAEGKSLGDDDRRFLDASQELEKHDIQKKLEAETQEKQILDAARRKANQRLAMSSVFALALVIAASWYTQQAFSQRDRAVAEASSANKEREAAQSKRDQAEKERNQAISDRDKANNDAFAAQREQKKAIADRNQAYVQANIALDGASIAREAASIAKREQAKAIDERNKALNLAEKSRASELQAEQNRQKAEQAEQLARVGTQLEQRGTSLLQLGQAEFAELQTLISALELGQDLKRSLQNKVNNHGLVPLESYPAISPILALRVSLNSIVEQNRIVIDELTGTNLVGFSSDGKVFKLVNRDFKQRKEYFYDISGGQIAPSNM